MGCFAIQKNENDTVGEKAFYSEDQDQRIDSWNCKTEIINYAFKEGFSIDLKINGAELKLLKECAPNYE